jgi:hypothetical protein
MAATVDDDADEERKLRALQWRCPVKVLKEVVLVAGRREQCSGGCPRP